MGQFSRRLENRHKLIKRIPSHISGAVTRSRGTSFVILQVTDIIEVSLSYLWCRDQDLVAPDQGID